MFKPYHPTHGAITAIIAGLAIIAGVNIGFALALALCRY